MCEFSHENSKLITLKKKDAILGLRFFKLMDDGTLKSLYVEFEFKSKTSKGPIPDMNGDLGFYSYNYNYNNYNNYNYNDYNYYNYNYNNNVGAVIKSYEKVITHSHGQRAERIEIISFLTLKDHKNKNFLKNFNKSIFLFFDS